MLREITVLFEPPDCGARQARPFAYRWKVLGDKRLDGIQTEDVQQLKSALGERAAKTVNNVLTVLSVMLRTAVEWGVIECVPCVMKLLRTTKNSASFHDFDEYERLVESARSDRRTQLVVLLGGEAGLRCGEIMAIEWSDVDLNKRQLCVARSEWKAERFILSFRRCFMEEPGT